MELRVTSKLCGRDLCPPLRLPKITNLKSPITDNKFRKQPGPIYLLFQICDLLFSETLRKGAPVWAPPRKCERGPFAADAWDRTHLACTCETSCTQDACGPRDP